MGKTLAIKGHQTRGEEVIELLKMMGGYADELIDNRTDEKYAYFIVKDENNAIDAFPIDKKDEFDFDAQIFTLEEFLEKYPYKIGDTVTVWVEDWENRRGSYVSVKIECVKWDDCRCEIIYVTKVGGMCIFFEAKDVKENMEEKDKAKAPVLKGEDYPNKRFGYKIPDGYEFDVRKIGYTLNELIDLVPLTSDSVMIAVREGFEIIEEQGKFFLKKKKPKYPKTFKECRAILNDMEGNMTGYKASLFANLQDLLICRDAYWKIAGEEMELGKPWEPDWTSGYPVYCISVSVNTIGKGKWYTDNKILAFPTEEMRDAFYENFKNLIGECKELL